MKARCRLLADYKSAGEILSTFLLTLAVLLKIMGLRIHVKLTRAPSKHNALALLPCTFMVPNEYFMCNTKIATILWATSKRPL